MFKRRFWIAYFTRANAHDPISHFSSCGDFALKFLFVSGSITYTTPPRSRSRSLSLSVPAFELEYGLHVQRFSQLLGE
jgi:hypothetical protein